MWNNAPITKEHTLRIFALMQNQSSLKPLKKPTVTESVSLCYTTFHFEKGYLHTQYTHMESDIIRYNVLHLVTKLYQQ